ncbi:MAG: ATP-binding cassette domain-containing protein [Parachlamydiales bacterium]
MSHNPLVHIKNLTVKYGQKTALERVSFQVEAGKTYGIVGKSGCGKSTLAKAIAGLIQYEGWIAVDGQRIPPISWSNHALWARKLVQMIFQDPYSCLNPKMTICDILSEPFEVHGLIPNKVERMAAIQQLLENVGLPQDILYRYPKTFSGGQRQRIAIARALAVIPRLLILDESLSALDGHLQQQLLALLRELQNKYGITFLFITHHLKMAESFCNRIGVMYQGRLVEEYAPQEVYTHEHTKELHDAHAFLESVC